MSFSRLIAAAVSAACLVSVGQALAVAQVARSRARAATQIVPTIPYVVGKTIDSAKAALAFVHRPIVQRDSTTNAQLRGRVVAQLPDSGTPVARTRTVTLWVAVPASTTIPPQTRRDTLVPNLYGYTPDSVRAALASRRLRPGGVFRDSSDQMRRGRVFRQDPKADTRVPLGQTVDVWYSLGPHTIDTVRVPKIEGYLAGEAGAILSDRSLKLGRVDTVYRGGADGKIEHQEPQPTALAHKNDAVDATVALPPPVRRTVVPDLSGKTPAEARRLLRADSLVLGTERGTTGDTAARVDEQNPHPGDTIVFYSSVDIHLATPIKPPEPKVVVVRRVPKLTDRREADARVVAARDSFTMRVGNRHRRIRLTEVVVSQTPGAGEADRGDAGIDVDLDIPVVPPPVVIVFGLVGVTEETIRRLRRKRIALIDETPAPDPPIVTSDGGDRLIRSTVEIEYDMDAPTWKVQSSSSTLIKSEKVHHG